MRVGTLRWSGGLGWAVVVCSILLGPFAARGLAAPGDDAPAGSPNLPEGVPAAATEAMRLMQDAQSQADPAAREKLLAQAQASLERFVADNPTHRDAARVEMQLGQLLLVRGAGLSADAMALEDAAAQEQTVEQARRMFRDGERHFSVVIETNTERMASFPPFLEPNSPQARERDRQRQLFIEARINHASAVEQLALTYAPGSDDYRQLTQAAADRYEQLYKEYRTLIAGLMARLKQGECYKNLGDTRRALGLYNDLLHQPADLEALRRLRVSAMYLSQECWTMDQEKLYELAFSQGEEYLAGQRPEEKSWPEWQAVRYYTSQGYLLAAGGLPAGRRQDRDAWLEKAREHADKLSKESGPYQAAAGELLKTIADAGK